MNPLSPSSGSKKIVFSYDYQNRRVRKQVFVHNGSDWPASPSEDWRFVWAGWRLLAEIDALATGDAPDATRRFVWGLDLAGQLGLLNSMEAAGGIGGLLAVCDPNDPCDPADTVGDFVYTYDANGNVGQLIDGTPTSWDAGTVMVARYEYDPYGKVTQSAGSYAAANPFRFSTKWFDAETGFGYWGERYYWPELGRWINRDPIEEAGGVNLYGYVINTPVNATDSVGLLSILAPLPIAVPLPWVGPLARPCPAFPLPGEVGLMPLTCPRWRNIPAHRLQGGVRNKERVGPEKRETRHCRQLDADYKNVCTGVERRYGGCKGTDSCGRLKQKMFGWRNCYQKRKKYRDDCIKKGRDIGHDRAINDAAGNHNTCIDIYKDNKCTGQRRIPKLPHVGPIGPQYPPEWGGLGFCPVGPRA